MDEATPTGEATGPRWQPLSAIDRRVLGVLVEKAKTTPEQYPMTFNALRSGCNQKSNRHPLMELEFDDVEASVDRLRALGAVALVHGGGRVAKVRHYFYDWLGVDKVEAAVMAELLLRGAQTEGELRGRAARMEPIADLSALRPVLTSLKEKGLVVPLTPEGRGHVVTHALYQPEELQRLRGRYGTGNAAASPAAAAEAPSAPAAAPPASPSLSSAPTTVPAPEVADGEVAALRREVDSLREQVASLRDELEELSARVQQSVDATEQLKRDLGV